MVLKYMVEAIEDAIQDGRSVDIGIGTVSPTISTVAAESSDDVKIRKKRILFRASKQLRTIVEAISVKLITDDDDAEEPENTGGSGGNSGGGEGGGNTDPTNPSTGGDDNGGTGYE